MSALASLIIATRKDLRKTSSATEAVAAYRAAESLRPDNERVCYNPLAKDFLGSIFTIVVKSRLLTKIVFWYVDRKVPGAIGCVAGHTRYIDDYLKVCIDNGIEQLVILGAGYDSRAYRFHELKGRSRVFEVDHPATQRVKIERVKRIFGSLPDNVVYVPIDFDREKLDKRLLESGYDLRRQSLGVGQPPSYSAVIARINTRPISLGS